MAASSWNSNFAAYGMKTWATWFLFLQGRHSKFCFVKFLCANELASVSTRVCDKTTYAIGVMSPQISQMCTRKASETSNKRSFKKAAAP